MKTSEFFNLLEQHPNKPLYFEYQKGAFVRPDYHITEIKNVTFETIDCGGAKNDWKETHIQLWENQLPEPDHRVDSSKALKIFKAVEKARPIFQDTEIKFEYGNATFHTAILPINAVLVKDDKIIVQLIPVDTTCKAKDRASTDGERAVACCGPEINKQTIQMPEMEANACTPGGGCC